MYSFYFVDFLLSQEVLECNTHDSQGISFIDYKYIRFMHIYVNKLSESWRCEVFQ